MAIASDNGLDELAQIALAHSVLARTSDTSDEAIASSERALDLAQRLPEYVTSAYALACAGDVLCHHNDERGTQLLGEARTIVARCPDPGIAGSYLARALMVGKADLITSPSKQDLILQHGDTQTPK